MTESDRPMSTLPQPPSTEPLRASLSCADDRLRLNHWMAPQQGIAPRIRIGRRWINALWGLPIGAAALLCLIAFAQSLRELPDVAAFIEQHPGIAQSAPSVELGLPMVAAAPALPEHVLHAVHHAGRPPDPGRPSTALLGARLYTRNRLVPFPGSGAEGSRLDRQGRLRHPADLARYSGPSSHRWPRTMVAFLGQLAVADQRHRLLCPAVLDRSVEEARAPDLGSVPGRALDGDPICVAELSRRS